MAIESALAEAEVQGQQQPYDPEFDAVSLDGDPEDPILEIR